MEGGCGQGGGLHLRQEDNQGLFVQEKGCGTRHIFRTLLNTGSHLTLFELFSGPASGLPFVMWQQRLQIRNSATSHSVVSRA